MKKLFIIIFLNFIIFNNVFAESYYFKGCQLNQNTVGDYLIDLDNNIIILNMKVENGTSQEIIDEIELVEDDKVISKKIKSGKSEDAYFIYYLDSNNNSVMKQNYKKESGIGLIRPDGPPQQRLCTDVKADWSQKKEEAKLKSEKENEEKIKLKKEKEIEEIKKKKEERLKEAKKQKNQHTISIVDDKWIPLSKSKPEMAEHLKNYFNDEALEFCKLTKNFEILEQKIEIVEIDETPAWGLESVIKFGINGKIVCK